MTLASARSAQTTTIRNDWTKAEVEALFAMPFNDLLFNAQVVHRQHFNVYQFPEWPYPHAMFHKMALNFGNIDGIYRLDYPYST